MPSFTKRKSAGNQPEPTMQPVETYEAVIAGQRVTVKRYPLPGASGEDGNPAFPRPLSEMQPVSATGGRVCGSRRLGAPTDV